MQRRGNIIIHSGSTAHAVLRMFLSVLSLRNNCSQRINQVNRRLREELTVTVAKSPSGTLATMIPMRKMTASSQGYPRMNAMMKKETPRKTATPVMRWMK